jgi:ribose transport system substrate-binding protein
VRDPDGAVANLPARWQLNYSGYTGTVFTSRWANWKPAGGGPYTIGISLSALSDPYQTELLNGLKQFFADLPGVTNVVPMVTSSNSVSAQVAQFKSLIAQHVSMIVYEPLSPAAFVSAADQAAAAGIPSISVLNTTQDRNTVNVSINAFLQGAVEAAAVARAIGGKGLVLGVHGIPGVAIDAGTFVGIRAALALCPRIQFDDSLTGYFNDSGAQAAVTQYLAAHPRSDVAGVVESGPMTAGIMTAFQRSERPMPVVGDAGAEKAGLAYWRAHEPSYQGVALGVSAEALAFAAAEVAQRMLAGDGIKVSDISLTPVLITAGTLDQWMSPSWTFSTQGTATGPRDSLLPASLLNAVFRK